MRNGNTQQRIARLLLGLWGLMCLGNVVFRHAHRLPDGRLVSHAHLYKEFGAKCPVPAHQHTSAELAWLDCLGHAPFDALPTAVACPAPFISLCTDAPTYHYVAPAPDARPALLLLRGPPSA